LVRHGKRSYQRVIDQEYLRRARGWSVEGGRAWRTLGSADTARPHELLTPIARRLAEGNDTMRTDPVGIDAATELPN
jgi:hypothetical protein